MATLTQQQHRSVMARFMREQPHNIPAPLGKAGLAQLVGAIDNRLDTMQANARSALTGRAASITDADLARLIALVAEGRRGA